MRFSLVRYNRISGLRTVVALAISPVLITFLVVSYLFGLNLFPKNAMVIPYLGLPVAAFLFVYDHFDMGFSKIGSLTVDKNHFTAISTGNLKIESEIRSLFFYCGGTREETTFGLVLLLQPLEGAANFLEINGKLYQIFIRNKSEKEKIFQMIEVLSKTGVNTEIIKIKKWKEPVLTFYSIGLMNNHRLTKLLKSRE